MITSRTDFRDRILAPLKVIADAQSLYTIYDDTVKRVPTTTIKWARINVRHRRGSRASLGRKDGTGKFTQSGFMFTEIYTPRDDGLVDSDTLSAAFADSLRNFSDSDIWINDVSEVEVGEDGVWFRTDVIAEFQYDLIQ